MSWKFSKLFRSSEKGEGGGWESPPSVEGFWVSGKQAGHTGGVMEGSSRRARRAPGCREDGGSQCASCRKTHPPSRGGLLPRHQIDRQVWNLGSGRACRRPPPCR